MAAGDSQSAGRVTVIGGGLAGLAAAAALAERGVPVELLESRQQLGGRASSFVDPATGEVIDNCQHVSMGCCTNLADFCRRTGIADGFRRDRVLHFIGPDGRVCRFRGSRWLPAPLHLAGGLWGLKYLSVRERISIGKAMLRLLRTVNPHEDDPRTFETWLLEQGQSSRACQRFWSVVLTSALAESLNRISLAAARKVFVDGFMAHRAAYEVDVPRVPHRQLYGEPLIDWLRQHGANVELGARVKRIVADDDRAAQLELASGELRPLELVVLAVPWTRLGDLLDPALGQRLSWLDDVGRFEASPISSVHLWYDRAICDLPHAVLVDRLSQWVFARPQQSPGPEAAGSNGAAHYYQVVISASQELASRPREEVIAEVHRDLCEAFPQAADAALLHSRLVTEHAAVFSPLPRVDALRPAQTTRIPNLFLAGDWTRTGWPSTMEGAVRSGYLTAEAVLRKLGRTETVLVDDLPPGRLMRWLGG